MHACTQQLQGLEFPHNHAHAVVNCVGRHCTGADYTLPCCFVQWHRWACSVANLPDTDWVVRCTLLYCCAVFCVQVQVLRSNGKQRAPGLHDREGVRYVRVELWSDMVVWGVCMRVTDSTVKHSGSSWWHVGTTCLRVCTKILNLMLCACTTCAGVGCTDGWLRPNILGQCQHCRYYPRPPQHTHVRNIGNSPHPHCNLHVKYIDPVALKLAGAGGTSPVPFTQVQQQHQHLCLAGVICCICWVGCLCKACHEQS